MATKLTKFFVSLMSSAQVGVFDIPIFTEEFLDHNKGTAPFSCLGQRLLAASAALLGSE